VTEARFPGHRRQLVVLGAGGTGVDAVDIMEAVNQHGARYDCIGFLDDDKERWGEELAGLRILGPLDRAGEWHDAGYVHAIGSPNNFRERPAILERLGISPARLESLIHPSAVVSRHCHIGRGVIVYPNVFLGPRVRVGDGVTILANATVNHDSDLGDWSIIASGANISGAVRVGKCCYLGTGAAVRERVEIGAGAMVGMGPIVIGDVSSRAVVVGNPAHQLLSPLDNV
jgi:sugar O-acyltransferase (sialic acid O-acetyltransferase NeuD family)